MKYNLKSVRDVCNGFSLLVCDFNDKSAIRNFRTSLSSVSDVVRRDYELFRIGVFSVESGIVTPELSPVLIFRGVECEASKLIERNVMIVECNSCLILLRCLN